MSIRALGDSSYFMMLIDKNNKKTWLYFFKGKTKACNGMEEKKNNAMKKVE